MTTTFCDGGSFEELDPLSEQDLARISPLWRVMGVAGEHIEAGDVVVVSRQDGLIWRYRPLKPRESKE